MTSSPLKPSGSLLLRQQREKKKWLLVGDFLPLLAMLVVQFLYAGLNITSKLAMMFGMNPLILVAYRQMFATIVVAPLAYFFERKERPKITKAILLQILQCSICRATGNQVFYYLGLEFSTPTIACALTNVLPAATFVLTFLCRQESMRIKTRSGAAKVIGTVMCVGGAMFMSVYRGNAIKLVETGVHVKYAKIMRRESATSQGNNLLGPFFFILSSVSWAAWFVLQARVNDKFPAPYTNTTLVSFMVTIECGAIVVGFAHKTAEASSLKTSIRLVGALYAGVACFEIAFCLTSLTIQKKGPFYASIFRPFLLIIMVVSSWVIFGEKLYIGTLVGSLLIVVGLYVVLWRKTKEAKLQQDIEMEAVANYNKKLQQQMETSTLNIQLQQSESTQHSASTFPRAQREFTKSEDSLNPWKAEHSTL